MDIKMSLNETIVILGTSQMKELNILDNTFTYRQKSFHQH